MTTLTEEREQWRRQFESGQAPNSNVLRDYRANRDSSLWRTSRPVEELCEYILHLERELALQGVTQRQPGEG